MRSSLLRGITAVLLCLPLAGCMKITMYQEIFADGTADSRLTLDFSELIAISQALDEMGSGTGATTDDETMEPTAGTGDELTFFSCDEYLKKTKRNKLVETVTCQQTASGVYAIALHEKLPRSQVKVRKSGGETHLFLRTQGSCSSSALAADCAAASEDGEDATLVTGTYTIVFPGPIVSANIGKIQNGNRLYLDSLDELGRRGLRVHAVVKPLPTPRKLQKGIQAL